MTTSIPSGHIAIQDTSVMLDLSRAGLVQHAFRLPVTYCTAEQVFQDLSGVQQAEFSPYIETTQLRTVAMDGAMFATIAEFSAMHRELSENDLSVYHLATTNNWPLIASCNKLRSCTRSLGLTAHSTYWVLDLLVENSLVTIKQAGTLLQQMATANPRLAPEDYEKRKKIWQQN
ncbi:hypothetical protein [Hymenobacter profundi]|uniref:PIN domain-containing protein n=1 Tax=Hymenobacter profundi TaxID=1982110 RepID=A0ABS6WUE1_9BACT|nr:hypothetical protein [Hymenobacter profundi]MBW3127203.1 hypothetical protein [Hymenobacter profundi]